MGAEIRSSSKGRIKRPLQKETLDVIVELSTLKSNAQQLRQLNREYLELLKQQAEEPKRIFSKLKTLTASECEAIAAACVPLFSIKLDEEDLWLTLFSNREISNEDSSAGNSALLNSQRNFVMSVLSFAWHLARHDRLAAKILLDVNELIIDALRNMPITDLPLIAHSAVNWLMPRWPHHPRFWPELLRPTRQNRKQSLHLTHLLGRQLLASRALKKSPRANKLLQRQRDILPAKTSYAIAASYRSHLNTKSCEYVAAL